MPSQDKKKRSRKWQGLKEQDGTFVQVADGPVVSSAFTSDGASLLTSTLLGKLAQHDLSYDDKQALQINTSWTAEVRSLAKVNGIALSGMHLVVGGILKDGRGSLEVWSLAEGGVLIEQMSQLSL